MNDSDRPKKVDKKKKKTPKRELSSSGDEGVTDPKKDTTPLRKKAKNEDAEGVEASLNRLAPSIASNGKVDGEYGDHFPLLALPNELITQVFSSLPIRDRLRARVNKQLHKIEMESKHYVEKLYITEWAYSSSSASFLRRCAKRNWQCICFIGERSYSSDCIRKIAQNTSVRSLKIKLNGATKFHREAYHIIKSFDVERLNLGFGVIMNNEGLEREFMVDPFFLDLTRICKELKLQKINVRASGSCENITPAVLHQLHKAMIGGSTKLRKLEFVITKQQGIAFLKLIGITYIVSGAGGRFYSRRNIEVTEKVNDDDSCKYRVTNFFEGRLEISLHHYTSLSLYGLTYWDFGECKFELHDTKETLEKAKNRPGFIKVDITP